MVTGSSCLVGAPAFVQNRAFAPLLFVTKTIKRYPLMLQGHSMATFCQTLICWDQNECLPKSCGAQRSLSIFQIICQNLLPWGTSPRITQNSWIPPPRSPSTLYLCWHTRVMDNKATLYWESQDQGLIPRLSTNNCALVQITPSHWPQLTQLWSLSYCSMVPCLGLLSMNFM